MIFLYCILRGGSRISSLKSVERYVVHGLVGLLYACGCLFEFFTISCFGLVFNYDAFPYSSRSVGSVHKYTVLCHHSGLWELNIVRR
jgi:hypothetical protein